MRYVHILGLLPITASILMGGFRDYAQTAQPRIDTTSRLVSTESSTAMSFTGRYIRDYYPMLAVGDFWFMKGEENVGAVPDDFRREITGITASGIEFFTSTTTNDQGELQEFGDVLTMSGALAVTSVAIISPLSGLAFPSQVIYFDSPLVLAAEGVLSDGSQTSTSSTVIQSGLAPPFPPTVNGILTMHSRIVAFDSPVTIAPDGGGSPVTFQDTITIEYQTTLTIPGFVTDTLFRPLSARVTLARGVGPVELQEFVDTNSPGEVFRLKDGLINGESIFESGSSPTVTPVHTFTPTSTPTPTLAVLSRS